MYRACRKAIYLKSPSRLFATTAFQASQKTIGFVGLGNMGCHMANNLLKANHKVIAFDISQKSLDVAEKNGAKIASNPSNIAKEADIIITMLPSNDNVKHVYLGNDGILKSVQSGSLLIDSSTIDPAVSKSLADICLRSNSTYVDAPVSGGVVAAENAALTFMVGAPENEFPAVKQLLEYMGKNVVHCGIVGTGQAMKICNNMLLAICMIGTSETMHLGMQLGLKPELIASVLNTSSGRNWSSDTYNPVPGVIKGVPSSRQYEGGFGTDLMLKDLGLAQSASSSANSATPLGSLAYNIYKMMSQSGFGKKDFSSVYRYIQGKSP